MTQLAGVGALYELVAYSGNSSPTQVEVKKEEFCDSQGSHEQACHKLSYCEQFVEFLCHPALPQGSSNSTLGVLLLPTEVLDTIIGETSREHTDFEDHGTCYEETTTQNDIQYINHTEFMKDLAIDGWPVV